MGDGIGRSKNGFARVGLAVIVLTGCARPQRKAVRTDAIAPIATTQRLHGGIADDEEIRRAYEYYIQRAKSEGRSEGFFQLIMQLQVGMLRGVSVSRGEMQYMFGRPDKEEGDRFLWYYFYAMPKDDSPLWVAIVHFEGDKVKMIGFSRAKDVFGNGGGFPPFD